MKFSHKIKKIADPDILIRSYRKAVGRLTRPLPLRRFLQAIDMDQFEQIRKKYEVEGESVKWPKFVRIEEFLKMNIDRARDLDLDRLPPQRILDIGSGAGYFLFVAKVLGHVDGMGMDLPEPALYEDTFRLFGLKRVIHRVEKFQPLPDTGTKYDLITAFAIVFSQHSKADRWGPQEWEYFLDDAASRLNPGGRIFLNLNPHPKTGKYYDETLRRFFLQKGAQLRGERELLFVPQAR